MSRTTTWTCRASDGWRSRLAASPKAVLLVSHDRELLARAAARIVTLEPGAAGALSWMHGGRFAPTTRRATTGTPASRSCAGAGTRSTRSSRRWCCGCKIKADLQRRHGLSVSGRADPAAKFEEAGPPRRTARARSVDAADRRSHRQACRGLRVAGAGRPDATVRPRDLLRDRVAVLGSNGSGSRTSCGCWRPAAPTRTPAPARSTAPDWTGGAHRGRALGARVRPDISRRRMPGRT